MGGGPLTPISKDQLQFIPTPTDFTGLAADSLGSIPNLLAALDADLAEVAANVAGQIALGPQLDAGLTDLAGMLPGADITAELPQLGDIASAGSAADALAGTVEGSLNPVSEPIGTTPTTGAKPPRPGWTPDPNHPGCWLIPGGGHACTIR